MQWLITIIQEWLIANGYLTQAYFNRGDPGVIDFTVVDFTLDNAWHDLDLSAIVPANAQAADLRCSIRSTALGKQIEFRRKGNVNTVSKKIAWTQIANLRLCFDSVVQLDANRIIQYRVQDATFNQINLVVIGWWL